MNSRAKGVRGELAVAHLFKAEGFNAERGVQHDGRSGHADVEGVPYIWIEVKWNEALKVMDAMEQAERDVKARDPELLPVVIHKKNRISWTCTMRTESFLTMCGMLPFSVNIPLDGLVSMAWTDWIQIFKSYAKERADAD